MDEKKFEGIPTFANLFEQAMECRSAQKALIHKDPHTLSYEEIHSRVKWLTTELEHSISKAFPGVSRRDYLSNYRFEPTNETVYGSLVIHGIVRYAGQLPLQRETTTGSTWVCFEFDGVKYPFLLSLLPRDERTNLFSGVIRGDWNV